MDTTIISAVISAVVTLTVCLITNHAQNEKTRALLEYRMAQLESKMDKHNDLQDRVLRCEIKIEDLFKAKEN